MDKTDEELIADYWRIVKELHHMKEMVEEERMNGFRLNTGWVVARLNSMLNVAQ